MYSAVRKYQDNTCFIICSFYTQSPTFRGQKVTGQVKIIYYNLGLMFLVLSFISVSYDNILLTKVTAEIWEQASCEVKAALRRKSTGSSGKKLN